MTRNFIFKIIIAGANNTGKTTFLLNHIDIGTSVSDIGYPIGLSFGIAEFTMGEEDGCKLQVWDIKDHERFRFLNPNSFRGAKGCLLFFDVSNRATFNALYEKIEVIRANTIDIPIVLIGSKYDLTHKINIDEIDELIKTHNIAGFFYSSPNFPNGRNVILSELTRIILEKFQYQVSDLTLNEINYPYFYNLRNDSSRAKREVIIDPVFREFLKFFSRCPICGSANHESYLESFFYRTDSNAQKYKDRLLELMEESSEFDEIYYNKISIGIPCCSCHKKFFKTAISQ